MSTLETKLRTAAALDPVLGPLLGSSPFRWWDSQLTQGSAFPAVTVLRVSTERIYSQNGVLTLSRPRLQINCWSPDAEAARFLAADILSFLGTFSATGSASQFPNFLIDQRHSMFVQSSPALHQEILDVKIYNREDL